MPMFVVKDPAHSQWPPVYALAAIFLAAAVLAVGIGFSPAVSVTVDGAKVSVPAGSNVSQLQDEGLIKAKPGSLRAVNATVLRPAGGHPISILRNGVEVGTNQLLYTGDQIRSFNGSDRVEPVITTQEPIQFATLIEGKGPVMRLAKPGAVGVREVRKGSVSGIVTGSRVMVPADEMVVMRTSPNPTEKLIALTFDDGPWPGQTEKILDILKHEGVHATFFMLGGRVKLAPALAKRVAEEGHLIGNHTLSHTQLTKVAPAEVTRQIVEGAEAIRSATGVRPVWFRPPYGSIDAAVWKQTRDLRLKVALWTIDTRDWSHPGTKNVIAAAEKGARAGSIILMHDGGVDRTQTIAALPAIIRDLKAKGFVFVTLEELDAAN